MIGSAVLFVLVVGGGPIIVLTGFKGRLSGLEGHAPGGVVHGRGSQELFHPIAEIVFDPVVRAHAAARRVATDINTPPGAGPDCSTGPNNSWDLRLSPHGNATFRTTSVQGNVTFGINGVLLK